MKVVLFCGGFGMRLREYSDSIPKPMVTIGYRPILWHVMKYYAHYGHKDFILCLGWKADVIKEYFLNYDECASNDFVLQAGCKSPTLLNSDIHDWNITFVDTGTSASVGERLKAVESHLTGETAFLANYTDGLSDVELPRLIQHHHDRKAVATFVAVRPSQTFHSVTFDPQGNVHSIREISKTDTWMNGGFFVFSEEIFDFLHYRGRTRRRAVPPSDRRGPTPQLRHEGFWSCMDTYKELQLLHDMYDSGRTPWAVWEVRREEESVTA